MDKDNFSVTLNNYNVQTSKGTLHEMPHSEVYRLLSIHVLLMDTQEFSHR